ncbi:Imm1 family immunity protein [Streptomyces termitum]|uniref:Uncharacterized protein n=1 Tax=Streptomyces termitum TaxID=67368 RepID=A0A918WDA5_9ACTN|nr:Imm1 family immunity protein [Streptomyces termitum]GHB10075.1 hypothetical protein GCM10010305_61130 [Streptomyces termitum]
MMILSTHADKPTPLPDVNAMAEAIDRTLTTRASGLSCDTVSFLYRKGESPAHTEASLTVTVNHDNGYGGLVWYVDGETARRLAGSTGQEVADSVWVSANSNPPEFEPKILVDPWAPTYIHRTCAFPVEVLRVALGEFCANGNGDRPTCIEWTQANFDGTLLEEPDTE